MSTQAAIRSITTRPESSADGGRTAGGIRFREQLEQRGPLYATFGRFLARRPDFLPSEYANALVQIKVAVPPVAKDDFARALKSELGAIGAALAENLGEQPEWSTLDRCAYLSRHGSKRVLVQMARPPIPATVVDEFRKGVRSLGDHRTPRATGHAAIGQFVEWLYLANGVDRERAYLEGLGDFSGLNAEYPRLIPEICGGRFLAWGWVDGTSVAELMEQGSADAVLSAADCVLEQFLLLSIVDADLDLAHLVRRSDGHIAVRRASRLTAMPPAAIVPAARYISAVLSNDYRTAAHLLARLASDEVDLEPPLLEKLSNLEPELKVNFRMTTTLFENNWRALASIHEQRPMFLDFMHRNLLALSRWSADVPVGSRDIVTEAYWSVLTRVLRKRLVDYATPDNIRSSFFAGGMLMIEGMRQLATLADGLRDDELSLRVAAGSAGPGEAQEQNRKVRKGIGVTVLLMVLLIGLHWSGPAGQEYSAVAASVAACAAVALLWILMRME